jgi:hypothetical protein
VISSCAARYATTERRVNGSRAQSDRMPPARGAMDIIRIPNEVSMPEPSPLNPVIQLAASRFLAKPLYVVARLGIADLLASGPQTVDRLAASTKTHAPSLYRVMRSLSGIGVFRESADRTFELTPVSQALRAGEGSLRPMVLWLQDPSVDHIWENFLWSVQTGRPAVEKTHGMEAFRWLSTDAEVAAVFNDAMSSNAAVRYAAVLDA